MTQTHIFPFSCWLLSLIQIWYLPTEAGASISVRAYNASGRLFDQSVLLAAEVTGNGVRIQDASCLNTSTCSLFSNSHNDLTVNRVRNCIGTNMCDGYKFDAVVSDPVEPGNLELVISRNAAGTQLNITANCKTEGYIVMVSGGGPSMILRYITLQSNWSSTFSCHRVTAPITTTTLPTTTLTIPSTTTPKTTPTTIPTTLPTKTPTTTLTTPSATTPTILPTTTSTTAPTTNISMNGSSVTENEQKTIIIVVPSGVGGITVMVVCGVAIYYRVKRRQTPLRHSQAAATEDRVDLSPIPPTLIYQNVAIPRADYENFSLTGFPSSPDYENQSYINQAYSTYQNGQACDDTRKAGLQAAEGGSDGIDGSGSDYTALDEIPNDSHEYTTLNL